MDINYTKLESIHCALQELQQEFNIPNDHEHLETAFKFTEDIREEYLEEKMNKITTDMVMFWLGSTRGYESSEETEKNAYDVIWELLSGGGRLEQYQEDVIETWEEQQKEQENE
jgi:hypothetical protein